MLPGRLLDRVQPVVVAAQHLEVLQQRGLVDDNPAVAVAIESNLRGRADRANAEPARRAAARGERRARTMTTSTRTGTSNVRSAFSMGSVCAESDGCDHCWRQQQAAGPARGQSGARLGGVARAPPVLHGSATRSRRPRCGFRAPCPNTPARMPRSKRLSRARRATVPAPPPASSRTVRCRSARSAHSRAGVRPRTFHDARRARANPMSAADRRPRVLLCVCGSVAAVKVPQLACALAEFAEVKVALSKAAEHFFDRVAPSYDADAWAAFSKRADNIAVLRDSDEWASYSAVGTDPVLHIEARVLSLAQMCRPPPTAPPCLAAAQVGRCCRGRTAVGEHARQDQRRHVRQPRRACHHWHRRARAGRRAADTPPHRPAF